MYKYPSIGVARSSKCIEAIGRLRYELFIRRDGKKYAYADHAKALFLEPVDRFSLNFQATDHQRCLASVRMTWARDARDDGQLAKAVVHAGLSDAELSITVINSRLAIRDEMRAKLSLTEMFRSVYRSGYLNGARYCLVGTRLNIVDLYLRFGFCEIGGRYLDDISGNMTVVKLDLHDRQNLERARSPLLTVYDELISRNRERTRA